MIKTNLGLDIYRIKVKYVQDSSKLKQALTNCLRENKKIPEELFNDLKKADKICGFKLKKTLKGKENCYLYYFTVKNGYLINFFYHTIHTSYDNTIGLNLVYSHPVFRKLGYNSASYHYVVNEIFKNKNIEKITAQIVTVDGCNMLSKLNFMHDKKQDDYNGFFVTLLNPKSKNYKQLSKNYMSIDDYLKEHPRTFSSTINLDIIHF